MVEINEIKIFLDQYRHYNEIKLVQESDDIEQAVFYGKIKCIEAMKNLIEYLEDQD